MSTNWLDDAQLDALIASAENTRSKAVRFDPEAPGGFRALTAQEDAELIDAIRLPHQRHEDDRGHLTREQEQAERVGDRDRAETAAAHLEVLEEEHERDQRSDPRLPSRAEIDQLYAEGERRGWPGQTARAFEYIDIARDMTDERAAAVERGDEAEVAQIDRQRDQVDRCYRHWLSGPERDDEERER